MFIKSKWMKDMNGQSFLAGLWMELDHSIMTFRFVWRTMDGQYLCDDISSQAEFPALESSW